ncbi:MAG: amino acid adenylation domain-containing protein [bacterium]|nr:amino acid adenylation domain-containing protein [bacterium]
MNTQQQTNIDINASFFPLTLNQEAIWFEQKLYPGSPMYNAGGYITIKGPVQWDRLKKAVGIVVDKNDALRIKLHEIDGKPYQEFLPPFPYSPEFKDFSPGPDPNRDCMEWMKDQLVIPFDLTESPLFKIALLKAKTDCNYLVIIFHHTILDAGGLYLMFKHTATAYNCLTAGEEPPQFPSFKEYAAGESGYEGSRAFETDKQYWKKIFTPPPEPVLSRQTLAESTATNQPVPNKRETIILERELFNGLETFAAHHKTSPYYLFIAVNYIYFSRVSGKDDVVLGFPVSNRKGKKQKDTVGLFTGISPLRIRLKPESSLADLLRYISLEMRRGYRHQRFPISRINKNISHIDLHRHQLQQIDLAYLNQQYGDIGFGETGTLPMVTIPSGLLQTPLSMEVLALSKEQDIIVNIDYLADYLDKTAVQQYITCFVFILESLTHQADTPLKDIPIITPGAKYQLLDYTAPGHFAAPPTLPLARGTGDTPPSSEMEKQLAGIWEGVLGCHGVGIHDNFFDLGGHSLTATRAASRIQKEMALELRMLDIFIAPTIALMADLIQRKKRKRLTQIEPVSQREYYRLSNAQRRMWILNNLEKDGTHYNMPMAIKLDGPLDVDALNAAFQALIHRHESLRTGFITIDGEAKQVIHPSLYFKVKVSSIKTSSHAQTIEEQIRKNAQRVFDLTQLPLFSAELLKLSPQGHVLLLNMHHIISDGWSSALFFRQLEQVYNGDFQLPPLRIQYKDYAHWQQGLLATGEGKKLAAYWHKQLAGDGRPVLEFPTDHRRPEFKTTNGANHVHTLDANLTQGIDGLCKGREVTPFMALLTVVYVLLRHYTGQEDIILGSVIAGRDHPDLEDQIGFYANTLALRNRFSGSHSFDSFLQQVKRNTLEAYENQLYPFDLLVEELNLDRDTGRNPLFDIMVVQQSTGPAVPRLNLNHLETEPLPSPYTTSKFDLTFGFTRSDDNDTSEIHIEIEYNTDLLEEATVRRIGSHYTQLLHSILHDSNQPIDQLELLTDAERHQLTIEFNATDSGYPKDKTIVDIFEEQVEKVPDRVALSGSMSVSYNELNNKADQLAYYLMENHNTQPDDIIGVMADRSLAMVIGIFAILKAGGAYLPIEPGAPRERVQYMLRDSGARVLLKSEIRNPKFETNPNDQNSNDSNKNNRFPCTVLNFEHLNFESCFTLHDFDIRASDLSPSGLAYIIYTSGSTGGPRGVMVEHGSLVNTVSWSKRQYHLDPSDVILHFLSFSFDASVLHLFSPLLSGSKLVIVPESRRLDLHYFGKIIPAFGVTYIPAPPGFYHTLLTEYHAQLKGVRHIITRGESLGKDLVKQHYDLLPGTTLTNEYGPTENSICSTFYACSSQLPQTGIPIGRPIANTRCFILDQWKNLLPIGVNGEIFLGGAGIARGYLNNPQLTHEKFVWAMNSLLYRTGDLGRRLEDGNIQFIGRVDRQVKVRGFRIEPEEIEHHLRKHRFISEAAVIVKKIEGQNQLAAFIVRQPAIDWDTDATAQLKEDLAEFLPDHMVPGLYIQLEKLPLTTSGKINRKTLSRHSIPDLTAGTDYVPPRNHIEEKVAAIWREVLEHDQIGIHDNFFDLMGHSLKAIQVVSRVYKEMAVELPLRDVFNFPTIAGLARCIRETGETGYTPIQPVEKQEYYELSNGQRRLWVLHQFENVGGGYNMPSAWLLRGELNIEALTAAFGALIRRHEVLRTGFHVIDGIPRQVVHAVDDIHFAIAIETPAPEERAPLLLQYAQTPFDLTDAPLLRVKLLKTLENEYIFFFNIHHIIGDGWSMEIFFNQLASGYNYYSSLQSDEPLNALQLPELTIQYKDYAVWQDRFVQSPAGERQRDSWYRELPGHREMEPLNLPADKPRPAEKTYDGDTIERRLEPSLVESLDHLCKEEGVTLFMALLALTAVLLYRYTGQDDIVIGTPIAGRGHPDLDRQIGFYINTLALRSRVKPDMSFQSFLQHIKKTAANAYNHQLYPFDRLVDELNLDRDTGRHPLFDVMLIVQTAGGEGIDLKGIEAIPIESPFQVSKFDLTFNFFHSPGIQSPSGRKLPGEMLMSINYNTPLFHSDRIQRMCNHCINLLNGITRDTSRPLGLIELLNETEKEQILNRFNITRLDFILTHTLQNLFRNQVRLFPDRVMAVSPVPGETPGVEGTGSPSVVSISRLDLLSRSRHLARQLTAKGIKTGKIVAIRANRSVDTIIGILAVLETGAAYLPIALDAPPKRIRYMLTDSNAAMVMATPDMAPGIRDIAGQLETVSIPDMTEHPPVTDPAHSLPVPKHASQYDLSLAYVIYTSGSTGNPKGVMMEHRSAINLVFGMNMETTHQYQKLGTLKLALLSPYSFDASVQHIFGTLILGHMLHIVPEETRMDGEAILEFYERYRINVSDGTMTHIRLMLQSMGNRVMNLDIKHFIIGGEVFVKSVAEEFLARFFPDSPRITNVYGPTECCVNSTYYEISDSSLDAITTVPIGSPLPNQQIYILDRYRHPQPVGIPGQLYIGGVCVGRGYMNQPELTDEKFTTLRFEGFKPEPVTQWPYESPETLGGRVYDTGDLARWLPDGNIEFLGRIDHQVKIRGYRIEPGEIQRLLEAHPALQEALVMVLPLNDQMQPVAFIVPDAAHSDPGTLEETGNSSHLTGILRDHLAQSLPGYMIPGYFVRLDAMPLLSNGKIDKNALHRIDVTQHRLTQTPSATEPPRNETEELLVQVWQQVLGIDGIGINDNFFRIGGDSIKAIQISAGLHKHRMHVKISHLFANPTIKELAPYVSGTGDFHRHQQGIISGIVPLTAVQKQFFLEHPQHHHHFNQSFMLFNPNGFDKDLLHSVFRHLARHHDTLRMVFQWDETHSRMVQENQDDSGPLFHLETVDLTDTASNIGQEIEKSAGLLQSSIDLAAGPLFKTLLFKTRSGDHLLMVCHHLVVDGVSWRILLEDFNRACHQLQQDKPVKLPPKTISFKEWAHRVEQYADSEKLYREMQYWTEVIQTQIEPLPVDEVIEEEKRTFRHTRTVTMELDEDQTRQLLVRSGSPSNKGTGNIEINDILLTALVTAMHQWAGVTRIRLTLEGHGREDIFEGADTSSTVGWFTSKFPVVLETEGSGNLYAQLDWTRKTLRSIPHKGIGYGILRYLSGRDEVEALKTLPEPTVSFNYLGQFDSGDPGEDVSFSDYGTGATVNPDMRFTNTLDINGLVSENRLAFYFAYNDFEYREESIKKLAALYRSCLVRLTTITGGSPDEEGETEDGDDERDELNSDILLLNKEHHHNLFFFPSRIGLGITYRQLSGHIDNCAVYGLDYIHRPGRIFEYIDYITDIQPTGPYVLACFSSANLTFETAKALEQVGKHVSHIILLDAMPTYETFDGTVSDNTMSEEERNRQLTAFLDSIRTGKSLDDHDYIERIERKSQAHSRYLGSHLNKGQIHAHLHYIKSSDCDDRYNRWKPLTTGNFTLHDGSGDHPSMLNGDHLLRNVAIINGILAKIFKEKEKK